MTKGLLFGSLLALSVGANISLAYAVFKMSPSDTIAEQVEIARENNPFVAPRVFTAQANDILINFVPLRASLREYVAKQSTAIGVYFEYLPSGTSIGVNDREEFFQASLVKVPMAMVIYKRVEEGDISLTQELTIKENDLDPAYGVLWQKGVGHKLTVQEAIDEMLVYSDNTALKVLFHKYPAFLDEVFDYLDLPKDSENNLPIVSPKNYASIFRALFLSSYLRPEFSNEILEILTMTNFHDKLPAGVPEGIPVAHKIGVLRKEGVFSDCGVIYPPERPYILCVMVRGTEDEAREHTKTISKTVYEYIVTTKQED